MSKVAGLEVNTICTINGLIGVFKAGVADTHRRNNKFYSAEEMRLQRAVDILEKAGRVDDRCHCQFPPTAIRHIAELAWEIANGSVSEEISALEINPLVLFLK